MPAPPEMKRFYKSLLIALPVVVAASAGLLLSMRPQPPGPVQPVAFSHRVHAGNYQMACLYCHTTATRSAVAGVPPVQTCYECHRAVSQDSPEIVKVLQYWEQKQPIPWVRVHSLPDFVYFSHKRHVLAEVSCQTCHGGMEGAEQVRQEYSLSMGWCVDCHKQRSAPLECSTCHK